MTTILKYLLVAVIVTATNVNDSQDYVEYQKKTLEESIEEGQWIYEDFCSRCHLPSGAGVSGVYPPLNNSDWLKNRIDESIASVKYGLQGEIEVNGETYNNVMTSMGLSDEEVADVMNYVMNSWENTQNEMITAEKVKSIEKP